MKTNSNSLFHELLKLSAAIFLCPGVTLAAPSGPDPIFEKPAPLTMTELEKARIEGVRAIEVKDFAYPGYKGGFKPGPPHADLNPQKAIIIVWSRAAQKFVFSHEASYCPWMQMPSGLGLCNQFFEGNNGWAELFNNNGRKTRNSFVDIIESGPQRCWVRWNYFCVNANDDSKPALRGTEDYIAYPNGLVWRRLAYESLMPDKLEGYSWQPVDFFAAIPPGISWEKLMRQDLQHGDYHVAAVLDAASKDEYDLFFSAPGPGRQDSGSGHPRRNGGNARLQRIAKSPLGFAMVMPCAGPMPFIIFGDASGFSKEKSQLVDHSFNDTGGDGWGAMEWDHWPVAWINSQAHTREPDSPYPYHIGPMSHYIVAPPLTNGPVDYFVRTKDMNLNRWSEQHVYYTIQGVGKDFDSIRRLAKQWLEKGQKCADPDSVGKLRW
jgi:hypothetical protein